MLPTKILKKLLTKIDELEKLDKKKYRNIKIDDDSDSDDDDDDDGTTIVNVDEYQYDIEEIKNPIDNHCLKCRKKFTNCHDLAICKACMYNLVINKTAAMKIYNLKNNDLENIDCYQYRNTYGSYTNLYLIKEIRLAAIIKRFGLISPSLNEYTNCVQTLLEEASEKEKKSKINGLKMIEARERNKELKIKKIQLEYNERKSKLEKALGKKNIILDKDCDACHEYLNNIGSINLEQVVELAKAYHKRKSKLEAELAKKNLVIRDDSYYCRKYLKGKKFNLQEVVEMMEIMDFFSSKTDYFNLTKSCLQEQYDEAKEYGYWDGQKIMLCEDEKDKIKTQALKKYLKKHSDKNVPSSVLNRYNV